METWELNEKKKEYLNGYKYAKRREKRILEQIQQLRLDAMFPCLQGDGMPRGSSQSDLSDYMEKYDELVNELKEKRTEAIYEYAEVYKAIQIVKNEDEKELLERRYILLQKWEDIAKEIGCTTRAVHKIHGRALAHFNIPN